MGRLLTIVMGRFLEVPMGIQIVHACPPVRFVYILCPSEALEATFAALADSLTSNDARLVRDLSDKWFSTSGSTLLATDFVINYAANDTYYNNNVGFSLSSLKPDFTGNMNSWLHSSNVHSSI